MIPVRQMWDSLSGRLLMVLISTTLAVWTASSVSIYLMIKHELQEIFDESLAETAHALLSIHLGQLNTPHSPYPEIAQGQHHERIIFQIWRQDGQLIYRSVGLGQQPLLALPTQRPSHPSYGWVDLNGQRYRTLQVTDQAGHYHIQIAEQDHIRQQIFHETGLHLISIALFFMPILALLIIGMVRISLRPLAQLTTQIHAQSSDALQPIALHHVPKEVLPLVAALNHLLTQISDSFEREKRFTANAAHELRTPLAAIRLHTQVLQGARDPAEAQEAITDIQAGVDRCSRLMEQLLVLSRVDPHHPTQRQPFVRCDLADIAERVVTQYRFRLLQFQLTLSTQLPHAEVLGNPDHLEIVIRNLLDNAIRYRGDSQQLQMRIVSSPEHISFYMIDQGVGIAPAERSKVFDRFYRLSNAPSTGSGLGLSIVWQIIQQHHASIEITDGEHGQGCCFCLRFAHPPP